MSNDRIFPVVGVVLGGGRESGKSPGVEDGGVLLLVLEPRYIDR